MNNSPRWMQWVFSGAGCYNLVWGFLVMALPQTLLEWAQISGITPISVILFQCVGMTIAVIGLADLLAASDPLRYWPLIIAGAVGRILGPIGFLLAAWDGHLTWVSGWTIVTNDLLWLPFFVRMSWIALSQRTHKL